MPSKFGLVVIFGHMVRSNSQIYSVIWFLFIRLSSFGLKALPLEEHLIYAYCWELLALTLTLIRFLSKGLLFMMELLPSSACIQGVGSQACQNKENCPKDNGNHSGGVQH